jgi:hypothetical protein
MKSYYKDGEPFKAMHEANSKCPVSKEPVKEER